MMDAFYDTYNLSFNQVASLFSIFLVVVSLSAIGAAAGGQKRWPEGDIIYGWAICIAIFTLFGAFSVLKFTYIAIFLGATTIGAFFFIWYRGTNPGPIIFWRLIALSFPLLILLSAMTPTQWDELTSWLPNARFLLEHDEFPNRSLPKSPSVFPAYPYGIPIIIYLASKIAGFMVENGPAIFNLFLFLSFGLLITRIIFAVFGSKQTHDGIEAHLFSQNFSFSWKISAFAALVVTAFNPTYVTRLVFSSYADAPTTIAIGICTIMIWMMINALALKDTMRANSFAWQASLAATVALSLKQVNLIFFLLLLFAIFVVSFRDSKVSLHHLIKTLPRLITLPLLVYLVWRIYIFYNIDNGEFSFRAPELWLIDRAGEIFQRMLLIASKKGGYFGIMTLAVILAISTIWQKHTPFNRLALITAIIFLTYNAFLFLCYIAAFTEGEALRAASFWRYNTHLGGICLVFAAYCIAFTWHRYFGQNIPRILPILLIVIVVILPVALVKKLRFDLHPRYLFARTLAKEIATKLSPKDRLLVVDFDSDGQYLMVMRYVMHGSASIAGELTAASKPHNRVLHSRLGHGDVSHFWIYEASNTLAQKFDLPLKEKESYLFEKSGNSWIIVKSWAHP